jgi:hypothetical protein
MDEVKCIVCGAAATRVMQGRDYCAEHNVGHLSPEVPITPCEICGDPAVTKAAGRDVCRRHERFAA